MVQQLSTSSIDKLQRFTFDDYDLHGGIIHTVNSFSQLFAKHSYPKCVKELLGQLQCAVCLISDTLKVFGEITIQIRSHGRLKYALVKVNENFETIGLADIEGNITDNEAFTDIISKDAVLLITFAPLDGENYQCIVPLDKPSLAECIEDYYRQSIQVACQMKLFTNADLTHSSGMIITAIPTKRDKAMQLLHFEHITTLSDTITEEEMHTLSFNEILYRLFNKETVIVYNPVPITFKCSCSKEHYKNALACISPDQLAQIIQQDGFITATCHYCGTTYKFNEDESLDILAEAKKH